MASVRMTNALKEQIIDAYRKQCQTAYNMEHNVDKTINMIRATLIDGAGEDFLSLVDTAIKFAKKMTKHDEKFKHVIQNTNNYYGWEGGTIALSNLSNTDRLPIAPASQMVIVCNPTRPIGDNMSAIRSWSTSYISKWDDNKVQEPSDNYVDGDVMYIHNFGDEKVFLPFLTKGEEEQYQAKNDYAPQAELAILITDPKMCQTLQEIPKAKQKASDMVQKFTEFVTPITTLKKFLDEFPGGKTLVPADSMQAMAAPAAKRTPTTKVSADDLLTPDLKQEFNEVMLESTLLGGNND